MYAEIIVDISNSEVDRVFDYSIPSDFNITAGYRVVVPFGPRTLEGYVIDIKNDTDFDKSKVKPIIKTLDDRAVIGQEMLELMRFMVKKYHLKIVDVLRLFIPSQMRGGKVKELIVKMAYINPEFVGRDIEDIIPKRATSQIDVFMYLTQKSEEFVSELNKNFSASALRNLIARGIILTKETNVRRNPYDGEIAKSKNIILTQEQVKAIDYINTAKNEFILLHGVTGSGKTEVYMNAISKVIQENKTAIMLVPEISLTPQVLKNFRERFDDNVALLHSGLSAGERFDEWQRILLGEAKVVVGARSAIFAPLTDLGLIIIDEEHDSSYSSESNPRYNAHDIAKFRVSYNKCNLILGSATPSIESYYSAKNGEYKLIELKQRANKKPLPDIDVIDMCKELYDGNSNMFSAKLADKMRECIANKNQIIIFLNRRGYSSYVMCRSCGYVAKCSQCDVSLVYHRDEKVLKCHYCNNRYSSLDLCPQCKSPHIKQGYVGTQQVVEKLQEMFPNETILRMDNDTTQTKDAHAKILGEFAAKKAMILVGTQMIAKGHDFPDVTLVGIIDADMSLHFSDFRAIERTYQLVTQVSGRAGRDLKQGSVILQTYCPNHYVYRFAKNNDYLSFYEKEINLREVSKYPPFSQIIRVLVSSEFEEKASEALRDIFDDISKLQKQNTDKFIYFSAMRSPVKRIQKKHRMQIIMRLLPDNQKIIDEIYSIVDKHYNKAVLCFIEINPSNLS